MAKKTAPEIINDINCHLSKSSKPYYSDFYIGITNDIERRLFGEHNVDKKNAWWIWREATDKETAQEVEKYFLTEGMKGYNG